MGLCDFCGTLVVDARENNVLRGDIISSMICDKCRKTWDETRMMYYDVLEEEE